MPDVHSVRWLAYWCFGSLLSLTLAIVPVLPVSFGGHASTWFVVTVVLWITGVYILGSAFGQTRAMRLAGWQRACWLGMRVALDLAAMTILLVERALNSDVLFVLASVCAVMLSSAPLALYLSRFVDRAISAYVYASAATLFLAVVASSDLVAGFFGYRLFFFKHPFGQLFLRDIAFGVALWCVGRRART